MIAILEDENFFEYTDFLEELKESLNEVNAINDFNLRKRKIKELIQSIIDYSNDQVLRKEYLEASEFLYTTAEFLEDSEYPEVLKLYKKIITVREEQIDDLTMQGRVREIAGICLRISELYDIKLQDKEFEKKYILKSINFLKQESQLLIEFNETRKLTQNLQNIAELYLRIPNFKKAIKYYSGVIEIAKFNAYLDLLSYSYQQISSCYLEVDDHEASKNNILDGVEYFSNLYLEYEEKNENLTLAQICQILKNLYGLIDDNEQFINYSKKEAGAYVNLAESLKKNKENFEKISRYYRGAGLCYREIVDYLVESASCFVLAGNYSEKKDSYNDAAINFFDAASLFKELNNLEMAYKHFTKAGDYYWKVNDFNQSTVSFLNAYDMAIEGDLQYNRFGIFNQIVRGLSKIAKEGLQNKQFFTAATLILESIKFYEQLDTAKDFLLRSMVWNVYKYYYRAASLKKIGNSHLVYSYVLASISSILNKKLDRAWKVISEIDSDGKTIQEYKNMIKIMINWVQEGKKVEFSNFPYNVRRLIEGAEEILYLLELFKGFKLEQNMK